MFFSESDEACSRPTSFTLPFFLKRYGPKFQEWSVVAHETRPGHHSQVQGNTLEHSSTSTKLLSQSCALFSFQNSGKILTGSLTKPLSKFIQVCANTFTAIAKE